MEEAMEIRAGSGVVSAPGRGTVKERRNRKGDELRRKGGFRRAGAAGITGSFKQKERDDRGRGRWGVSLF